VNLLFAQIAAFADDYSTAMANYAIFFSLTAAIAIYKEQT
jgi:hypothetical protein